MESRELHGYIEANQTWAAVRIILAGNDTITGSAFSDRLSGYAGDDVIRGGSGADLINGGDGRNTLTGGKGPDVFFFAAPLTSSNHSVISDFAAAYDVIELDEAIFTRLHRGALPGAFFSGDGVAHDASDHLIYNPNKGGLYYDSDGSGSAHHVLVAILSPHLATTHNDFVVA